MNNKEILIALKNGNIPNRDIDGLCVGRKKEVDEFKNILNFVEDGKASTKFIYGEFGSGKSFFLKVIEEMAYKQEFVVSKITVGNNMPFHKIDLVYKEIAKSLKCKTGTSLNHIIERWITRLKVNADDDEDLEDDEVAKSEYVKECIHNELVITRDYSNSFAIAIEKYHEAKENKEEQTADYAQAWLRGDSNIPASEKKKFGVKGNIDKENALHFLSALSTFIKSIGYSGLIVLVDEAEFIMKAPQQRSRDVAYNYIRDIFDGCNNGTFENILFVFAGTYQFFEDERKGIKSYEALYSRIEDATESEYDDLRKPIINLKGFTKENIVELSDKIIKMHKEVYNWDTSNVEEIIDTFIDIHEENSGLTGGLIVPRQYIRELISVLDTVEQNQDELNNTDKIITLFKEEENLSDEEEDVFNDWE